MSRFDETLIVTIMQIIIRVSLTYLLVGRFVVQAVAIAHGNRLGDPCYTEQYLAVYAHEKS